MVLCIIRQFDIYLHTFYKSMPGDSYEYMVLILDCVKGWNWEEIFFCYGGVLGLSLQHVLVSSDDYVLSDVNSLHWLSSYWCVGLQLYCKVCMWQCFHFERLIFLFCNAGTCKFILFKLMDNHDIRCMQHSPGRYAGFCVSVLYVCVTFMWNSLHVLGIAMVKNCDFSIIHHIPWQDWNVYNTIIVFSLSLN